MVTYLFYVFQILLFFGGIFTISLYWNSNRLKSSKTDLILFNVIGICLILMSLILFFTL